MTNDLLERLIALSRKTGDRIIVAEGDQAFVLLPLEKYEEIVAKPSLQFFSSERSVADPIEQMNKEAASIREERAGRQAQALASVLEESDPEFGEEQFYLEPVE